MSINLLFSQIPLVGEISGTMQATPEVQQSIMNQAAAEVTGLQREQIQKSEKQDGANAVDEHGSGGGRPKPQKDAQNRKKQAAEETEEKPLSKTPFTGNLINRRI